MNPSVMPRKLHQDPTLRWLIAQPRVVIAWAGTRVTLMAGPVERTYNTQNHPTLIDLIRRKA